MKKDNSKNIFEWKYSDVQNRGKVWYIIAFSFLLGLVIWGVLTKQYGFSFVLILACGIYLFISNNTSEIINVQITETGIGVEDTFYDYGRIESYSIVYNGEDAVYLRLVLNKKGFKKLELRVDNEIARVLKGILPNYLPENEDNELSTSDKIISSLKL